MAHLELQCRHCERRLRMSDEHVGKTVRCPACKETFVAVVTAAQSGENSAPAQNSPRKRGRPIAILYRCAKPDESTRRKRPRRRGAPDRGRQEPHPVRLKNQCGGLRKKTHGRTKSIHGMKHRAILKTMTIHMPQPLNEDQREGRSRNFPESCCVWDCLHCWP